MAEGDLVALAVALGARDVAGWSPAEDALVVGLPGASRGAIAEARRAIRAGDDPLGVRFCSVRGVVARRGMGATYTPREIVAAMVDWAGARAVPDRVVDPGAGSGRFLVAAGRRFGRAELVGVEVDPVAAILARANLATLGLAPRARVVVADYRDVALEAIEGRTLFLGNPPYVRHHRIEPGRKAWLAREAGRRGLKASRLAGLHVHFFLATASYARPGDFGTFVSAAEWLDVNYGSLARDLFVGDLGGSHLLAIEPSARPFADAATTAAIIGFSVGSRPATVTLGRAASLDEARSLGRGRPVARDRLAAARRWSPLTRPARPVRAGMVELGELCRVHRGQVTGANRVWVAGPHASGLPTAVLHPSVTRARELFRAGPTLDDASALRRVVDLPADLDALDKPDRDAVARFLAWAKGMGADRGYVARARRAWWSVGLRAPAPILATYMARRPPAFVRNRAGARHINIAHGLYPRQPLAEGVLIGLAAHLSAVVLTEDGRTYAGGLTKFEPGEMERLLVPRPERLAEMATTP